MDSARFPPFGFDTKEIGSDSHEDMVLAESTGLAKHFETGFIASKTVSKRLAKPVSKKTGFNENRSVAGFIENRFRLPVSGSVCGHPDKSASNFTNFDIFIRKEIDPIAAKPQSWEEVNSRNSPHS